MGRQVNLGGVLAVPRPATAYLANGPPSATEILPPLRIKSKSGNVLASKSGDVLVRAGALAS